MDSIFQLHKFQHYKLRITDRRINRSEDTLYDRKHRYAINYSTPTVFVIIYSPSQIAIQVSGLGFFFIIGIALSVSLVLGGTGVVPVEGPNFAMYENIVLVLEVLVILYILAVSAKYKNWPTLGLGIISAALFAYTYANVPGAESASFNIDQLSQLMILIVNIVGTAIILFATGYMDQYEEHRHLNRQRTFYFTMSFFLAAMNGLVMSDTLGWLYLFWELTTLCSFVLISYNMDEEGINNGFRALSLNLVGGVAMSIGIILLATKYDINSLTGLQLTLELMQ